MAELCATLAENRHLRSLAVDLQIVDREQGARKQEEEEEKGLLEPFRTRKGVRDGQFTGAVGNWNFLVGLRDEMVEGRVEGRGRRRWVWRLGGDVEGLGMEGWG